MITVAAPAYVPGNSEDRKGVVVGEDENVEGVNFSLVRGGVITGKVTDADGRPLIQHQIEIYRVPALERRTPQRPAFPTITGQTDDRGIYRVYGIAPGSYKVAAGRSNEGFNVFSPTQLIYKQVFHPDASDPAKATVIEVTEGSEAKDVDIMLGRPVQTFAVSGRIINTETNAPVPNQSFGLQRVIGPRFDFGGNVATSNARGEFILEGVLPGKYSTLFFQTEGSDLPKGFSITRIEHDGVQSPRIEVKDAEQVSQFDQHCRYAKDRSGGKLDDTQVWRSNHERHDHSC